MPNDAKLGLVAGVGLLIVVAVVFFRKELTPGATSLDPPPSHGIQLPAPPATPPANNRVVSASPTSRSSEGPEPRRHTVRAGDTLGRLALQYYGDGEQFQRIGTRNDLREGADDALPQGRVLVIPDASNVEP